MQKFTPSLDWGNELIPSLLWIAKGWLISAVCVLVISVLVIRFTSWGRQFWRITGEYFTGPDSAPVWGMLALLLLSVVTSVRIDVLLSYYANDLYSSLQVAFVGVGADNDDIRNSGIHGFWMSIVVFCIIATLHVIRAMLDLYLMQRFIIRWRVWLTERLTGDWLEDRAYYRSRFIDDAIDNPDQRIQLDIDIFTAGYGPTPNNPNYGSNNILFFGAIKAVVSVVSFTAILWTLSGDLDILGWFVLPKALFWIVLAYVTVTTIVAFWIGHPLIRYSFRNELTNAAFRYALVRLRDAAEAVGFYRGERAERVQLRSRFNKVIDNYRRYVRRSVAFQGWDLSVTQAIAPLPFLVQAPRLFAGQIQLGGLMQSTTAFSQIQTGLSYFRQAYDYFASYRASIIRLHGLVVANERARALPTLVTADTSDGSVELVDVEVRTPSGARLVDPIAVRLSPGDSLVIVGQSGSGKTTLLRSLAELWPFASGTVRRPGDHQTMFLSQMPYVPLGDLRAVVSYPAEPGDINDVVLRQMLVKVALGHLAGRLNDERDWVKVLSPGEQQRIAFARILLTKPRAVFLDEATSALDQGLEFALYELVRTELPDCIVVSVSHRPTVEQHHEQLLELLGDGAWRLGRVGEQPAPAPV